MLISVSWVHRTCVRRGACFGLGARVGRSRLVAASKVAPRPRPRLRRWFEIEIIRNTIRPSCHFSRAFPPGDSQNSSTTAGGPAVVLRLRHGEHSEQGLFRLMAMVDRRGRNARGVEARRATFSSRGIPGYPPSGPFLTGLVAAPLGSERDQAGGRASHRDHQITVTACIPD